MVSIVFNGRQWRRNQRRTVNDAQADNFGPRPFSVRDVVLILAEHLFK